MWKNVAPPICMAVFLYSLAAAQQWREQEEVLERYDQADITTVVDVIRKDLLSKDVLVQDAGCIILSKALDGFVKGDRRAESVFAQLSGDRNVVASAADIIDSRLLGWYNRERPDEDDDDIGPYVPLFHILAGTDSKTARETLARSFLFLHNRTDVLKGIVVNEELVGTLLKRLRVINERYCCVFPGREFVAEMLEKDSRLNMLDIYEDLLMAKKDLQAKVASEMSEFIAECLDYGDAKNGHTVRVKAAKIAGMLMANGESGLKPTIEDMSRHDPYFVHKKVGRAGYSIAELRYPVRDICSKIMLVHGCGRSAATPPRQAARP
jgi:hypothetical protein